jgi:hypothetical protein
MYFKILRKILKNAVAFKVLELIPNVKTLLKKRGEPISHVDRGHRNELHKEGNIAYHRVSDFYFSLRGKKRD